MPTREEILALLEEKRNTWLQGLKNLMEIKNEYMEKMDEAAVNDESDQAQREVSLANVYGMIERKTKELREIDRLINKIKSGEDCGICEECGEEIPINRLLAMPGTTLCVECQKEREKKGMAAKTTTESVWTTDYEEIDWMDEGIDELGLKDAGISTDIDDHEGGT